MARLPRISVQQYYYHIFSRGNNREPIFFEPANYERFLQNLDRFQLDFGYRLYTYCLMPNHFHLLLRPGKTELSRVMQTLMTAYSMYVNKRCNHVGHIFQGRFKSIIVEKESYLLEVIRYIHLNPVRAGLVARVEEYPWSSYMKYMSAGDGKPKIETGEILALFSQNSVNQKQSFKEFTESGLGSGFDPEKEQARGVLGTARFHQALAKVLKGKRV